MEDKAACIGPWKLHAPFLDNEKGQLERRARMSGREARISSNLL